MISEERINDFEEPDFTTSNEYARLYNFCCQLMKERKQLVDIAELANEFRKTNIYGMSDWQVRQMGKIDKALRLWRGSE